MPKFSNSEICKRFLAGHNSGSSYTGNLYIADNVLYSYGTHYPAAIRGYCNTVLINTESYSVTSSAHTSEVSWEASKKDMTRGFLPFSALPNNFTPNNFIRGMWRLITITDEKIKELKNLVTKQEALVISIRELGYNI